MSNIPVTLKYSKSHEWARIEGDTATVGITDHAQHELTDIVFVELLLGLSMLYVLLLFLLVYPLLNI